MRVKAKTSTSVATVSVSQKTTGRDNRLPTKMPKMKKSETQGKGMGRLYNKTARQGWESRDKKTGERSPV